MKVITWQDELELLNDEQLKRIAFADKDSWGIYYSCTCGDENECCIVGHILGEERTCGDRVRRYHLDVNDGVTEWTPLEHFYMANYAKETFDDVIKQIQEEACKILNKRQERIKQPIEIEIEYES